MSKGIIKEIIIMLLLIFAIILILGILLYEFVPVSKIIPEKVSYVTPENVKKQLQTDTNVDDSEVIVTYQIDSTDLSNYKKIQEYVSGKKNPFESMHKAENTTTTNNAQSASSATNTTNTTNTDTASVNSNASNDSNKKDDTDTNKNTESNAGYIPDKGTK